MASNDGTTIPTDPTKGTDEAVDVKGKGKSVATEEPVDQSMMDEDDDDDSGDEEVAEEVEEDEDNLEEIDLNNIVDGGRRTRGKVIDWAKAAEENPVEEDDDDDEDEFEPEAENSGDKMDED